MQTNFLGQSNGKDETVAAVVEHNPDGSKTIKAMYQSLVRGAVECNCTSCKPFVTTSIYQRMSPSETETEIESMRHNGVSSYGGSALEAKLGQASRVRYPMQINQKLYWSFEDYQKGIEAKP